MATFNVPDDVLNKSVSDLFNIKLNKQKMPDVPPVLDEPYQVDEFGNTKTDLPDLSNFDQENQISADQYLDKQAGKVLPAAGLTALHAGGQAATLASPAATNAGINAVTAGANSLINPLTGYAALAGTSAAMDPRWGSVRDKFKSMDYAGAGNTTGQIGGKALALGQMAESPKVKSANEIMSKTLGGVPEGIGAGIGSAVNNASDTVKGIGGGILHGLQNLGGMSQEGQDQRSIVEQALASKDKAQSEQKSLIFKQASDALNSEMAKNPADRDMNLINQATEVMKNTQERNLFGKMADFVKPVGRFATSMLGQGIAGPVLAGASDALGGTKAGEIMQSLGLTNPYGTDGGGSSGVGQDPYTPLINQAQRQLQAYGSMAMSSPQAAEKYKPMMENLNMNVKNWQTDRKEWHEGKQKFGHAPFGSDAQKNAADLGNESERLTEKKHMLYQLINNPNITGAEKIQAIRVVTESILANTSLIEGFKRIPQGVQAVSELQSAAGPTGSLTAWLDKTGEIVPEKIQGTLRALEMVSEVLDNSFDTTARQNSADMNERMRYFKYYKPTNQADLQNMDPETASMYDTGQKVRHDSEKQFEDMMKSGDATFGPNGVLSIAAKALAKATGAASGGQAAEATKGKWTALINWGLDLLKLAPQDLTPEDAQDIKDYTQYLKLKPNGPKVAQVEAELKRLQNKYVPK